MPDQLSLRILVGSYEHSLLCLAATLPLKKEDDEKDTREPHFVPIFHFAAHSLSIKTMDLAKRYLVTGANDEHIRIYDLQKRKELGTLLQHQGSITKLCFSNETNSEQYPLHKQANWLLSSATDGTILLWRTKDWELFKILKGHKGAVYDLSIHPSNRIAISTGEDQTVRLWNLMTGKKASGLKLKGAWTRGEKPEYVRFSPDGEWFVVGFRNRLMIWKTREGKLYSLWKTTNRKVMMCMEFLTLNNKDYLVMGFSDGTVQFWDFTLDNFPMQEKISGDPSSTPELPKPEHSLQGHSIRIKGISFYKEKRGDESFVNLMVSISSDGQIVIWNLETMSEMAVYSTGERLNTVCVVEDAIEKTTTMKPIYDPTKTEEGYGTESEYESDAEGLAEIMQGKSNTKKKMTKRAKLKAKKAKKDLLSINQE